MSLDVGLRRVYHIHVHLHLLISYSVGIWLASLQRSVLLVMSGQQTHRIPLWQLLMTIFKKWFNNSVKSYRNVCSLEPFFYMDPQEHGLSSYDDVFQ